jgi:hypothetical protein
MSVPLFFEGERARFFRPLNSSRRELVVACLRALYQRLHSPSADQHQNLTRELLRELLLPVVREYQDNVVVDAAADEFNVPETNDPQQLTAVLVYCWLMGGSRFLPTVMAW